MGSRAKRAPNNAEGWKCLFKRCPKEQHVHLPRSQGAHRQSRRKRASNQANEQLRGERLACTCKLVHAPFKHACAHAGKHQLHAAEIEATKQVTGAGRRALEGGSPRRTQVASVLAEGAPTYCVDER